MVFKKKMENWFGVQRLNSFHFRNSSEMKTVQLCGKTMKVGKLLFYMASLFVTSPSDCIRKCSSCWLSPPSLALMKIYMLAQVTLTAVFQGRPNACYTRARVFLPKSHRCSCLYSPLILGKQVMCKECFVGKISFVFWKCMMSPQLENNLRGFVFQMDPSAKRKFLLISFPTHCLPPLFYHVEVRSLNHQLWNGTTSDRYAGRDSNCQTEDQVLDYLPSTIFAVLNPRFVQLHLSSHDSQLFKLAIESCNAKIKVLSMSISSNVSQPSILWLNPTLSQLGDWFNEMLQLCEQICQTAARVRSGIIAVKITNSCKAKKSKRS